MAETAPVYMKLGISVPVPGISTAVPCVQELVKGRPTSVPPRYIRTEDGMASTITGNESSVEVPVIDYSKLVSCGDARVMDHELQRLDSACVEWGFFLLTNHGVSSVLIEDVKESILQLFNLPMEEKSKYWQEPGDNEGFGQSFIFSEEQKLDWSDKYSMIMLPKHLRNPKLLPKLPPRVRDAFDAYSAELQKLAMKILALMERALKMDVEEMNGLFEEGMQAFRINYYPPCPQPELVHGLTPHSDGCGLTILLQVNEIEGLQIRKDGNWVSLRPLPDAFVINVGDILEILTNGIYRSIEHRGMTNPDKERISIAAFFNPKVEGDLAPVPSMITPENPQHFKRLSVSDYFKGLFSRKLGGKSHLDTLRI